jgi:hypothetical protein
MVMVYMESYWCLEGSMPNNTDWWLPADCTHSTLTFKEKVVVCQGNPVLVLEHPVPRGLLISGH